MQKNILKNINIHVSYIVKTVVQYLLEMVDLIVLIIQYGLVELIKLMVYRNVHPQT